MSDEEREYLWKHFAFSAEQRPKAFNFFVVFSGFANGGILAAFNRNSQPAVFVALGSFVCLLSTIFARPMLRCVCSRCCKRHPGSSRGSAQARPGRRRR